MRNVDALAAGLLLAGAALGHGVHDLRGTIEVEATRLRIDVATHGEGYCLRLLDELHVRDARGVRRVGTEREEAGRCRLEYALGGETTGLTLQLRPAAPGYSERLILCDGADCAAVLVLTGYGNIETPGTRQRP
jgi:hypothetical protein